MTGGELNNWLTAALASTVVAGLLAGLVVLRRWVSGAAGWPSAANDKELRIIKYMPTCLGCMLSGVIVST